MSGIVLELPIHTLSELNARGHWAKRAKRAKSQRTVVGLTLRPILVGRVLPCTVMITRIAPRALDCDNLRGATKAVRDGIADALGVDDRDPRVSWLYAQARGAPKSYAVRIEVEALRVAQDALPEVGPATVVPAPKSGTRVNVGRARA